MEELAQMQVKKSRCLLNLVAKCHVKRNLPIYKTSK